MCMGALFDFLSHLLNRKPLHESDGSKLSRFYEESRESGESGESES